MSNASQQAFMQQALNLAKKLRGQTAPNPSVGCVVVKDNKIVAEGIHLGPGQWHAERQALLNMPISLTENCELYVTLEPCCHWGKTPPCTDIIIEKKIGRIFYGFGDPNPQVAGNGIKQLQQAGIPCEHCSLEAIDNFYQSYAYWHQQQLPFTRLKLALSADSKIAAKDGKPAIITGQDSNYYSHQQRNRADAILTSVKTVLNDDPQLNVRLDTQVIQKPIFVLDQHLQTPLSAKIFHTAKHVVLLCSNKHSSKLATHPLSAVADIITVETSDNGLNLRHTLQLIAKKGIHELWIEVGGKLCQQFISEQLIQQGLFYVSNKSLGQDAYSGPALSPLLHSAKSLQKTHFEHDMLYLVDYQEL